MSAEASLLKGCFQFPLLSGPGVSQASVNSRRETEPQLVPAKDLGYYRSSHWLEGRAVPSFYSLNPPNFSLALAVIAPDRSLSSPIEGAGWLLGSYFL